MKRLLALLGLCSLLLCGCSVSLPGGADVPGQAGEMMDSLAEAAEEIAEGRALEDKTEEEAGDEPAAADTVRMDDTVMQEAAGAEGDGAGIRQRSCRSMPIIIPVLPSRSRSCMGSF